MIAITKGVRCGFVARRKMWAKVTVVIVNWNGELFLDWRRVSCEWAGLAQMWAKRRQVQSNRVASWRAALRVMEKGL